MMEYFVSVIDPDNPKRKGILLGPYTTHREALENVQRARTLAGVKDPRGHFYAYGTCGAPIGVVRPDQIRFA